MSTKADHSAGSAREIKVPDDLHSSVVREIVNQLNQQEIPISKSLSLAANGTLRVPLGSWRYDAWVKDIRIINPTAAALANAATDVFLRTCGPTDSDMAGGPASPSDILAVEGFGAGNFPAGSAIWGDEFVAGSNCDSVTGEPRGNKVTGGDILYAEFVNTEGGAAEIIVLVTVVTTDYMNLFSSHIPPHDEVPYQEQKAFEPGLVRVAPQFKVPYQQYPGHYFASSARKRSE